MVIYTGFDAYIDYIPQTSQRGFLLLYKLHVFKIWTKWDSLYFERKLKMVTQQKSDDHNPLFSRLDAL